MAQAKATILIIEDEPGFRKIYKDFLQNEGYTVLEADDGDKGLILINSAHPDLVLLDLVLPQVNGFEVLTRLRAAEATKDLPVIIFSVLGERDTVKKGLELGASDFAVKGFYSPGEMLSKIRSLLFKSDMHKHMVTYKVDVAETRVDAPKLEQDMGMTKLFECPHCKSRIHLELIPDYTRTDGHWFSAHFICPGCKTQF
ncbi:MAG TPA: response regulator [Candidatus Omnitrophota bacterium]|nr:response regulator [Candidatus Omnitrophota bacterium]